MSKTIRSVRRAGAALGLAAVCVVAPGSALAEETDTPEGAGLAAASMFATLLYGPAKLVYATTGSLVAGLAYGLTGGNADVALPILESSIYGDYYVTPDQLRGDRSLEFVGRTSGDAAPSVSSDGIPPIEAPPTDVSSSDSSGF